MWAYLLILMKLYHLRSVTVIFIYVFRLQVNRRKKNRRKVTI